MKISTFIGCCLIHLVIGSVYAQSILYNDILTTTGWPEWVPKTGFCLIILFLSAASIGIRFLENGSDERRVVLFGGIGYLLTQFLCLTAIINAEKFVLAYSWVPYLISCMLMGFNIGALYSITISRVSQAKTHPGILSGIVVSCFAMGSLIAAEVYDFLLDYGLPNLTHYFLICIFVIAIGTWIYKEEEPVRPIDIRRTFKNKTWMYLFIIFFSNIMIGLTLISDLLNLSITHGMIEDEAILLVGVAGIANGAGRLFWPIISDMISPKKTMLICLLVEGISLIFINQYWYVCTLIIMTCYGAGFALMPLICKEIWKEDGPLFYSSVLLAWGMSAIVISFIPVNIILMFIFCICALVPMTIMVYKK